MSAVDRDDIIGVGGDGTFQKAIVRFVRAGIEG